MDKVKIYSQVSLKKSNRSERGDFSIKYPAVLSLNSGRTFKGQSPFALTTPCIGEVVFNTGMSGYVESLTDPSYSNQILVFTYPLIGNYGVQFKDMESKKIQVKGVVVSELSLSGSHGSSDNTLKDWLESQNIPLIFGVDTRAVTKHLRKSGTMPGAIAGTAVSLSKIKLEPIFVTVERPVIYNKSHKKRVILVDCGAKENILRCLQELPVSIKRVPLDYDYTNEPYDGIVISNGPGDPADYRKTIEITKKVLSSSKPVFGICLGTQIMALAAGAKTYKLKFGHRGHNQPCIDTDSKHCVITSQNHGYAVKDKSLPKDWRVSYRNLNDNSVEGIVHSSKPFFAVQFHPEASPGPTDSAWLFKKFADSL